ncbi:MAG: DUF4350 domain-containing protein, partial [Verrucomicrobia bacterium]|nr:DUF4350 domain-containing protein [Cytophagales bacterium]
MNRQNFKYWLILALAVALVFAVEFLTPKEIDWTITYSAKDKNPYGSYLLYERLKDLFPQKIISSTRKTFYEIEEAEPDKVQNILLIDRDFSPDATETEALLKLVSKGSHVFIACDGIYGSLADTLRLRYSSNFEMQGNVNLNFVNPRLRSWKSYSFKNEGVRAVFDSLENTQATLLGVNAQNQPTLIKIPFGKGALCISSTPIAFTNFHLLKEKNQEYIAKSLSFLPVNEVLWNEHYKVNMPSEESDSPVRFILATPTLRWAYYILIGAVLIFIIFEAKRKQRIIPVVQPLANTTLEFTETVGSVYFQYKDHKNIADKKITYFLEYLRSKFFVKTTDLNASLLETLAMKSGVSQLQIDAIFKKINFIRKQEVITEADL